VLSFLDIRHLKKEAAMKNHTHEKPKNLMTQFWIWTIKNHNVIVVNIGIYTFTAVAAILFLVIGGVIHLQTALNAILFGGLANFAILWLLLEIRRSHLLKITNPELRQQAYEEMLVFIYQRKHKLKQKEKKEFIWNRFTKNKRARDEAKT
jgi:hypothetical protein